jgi:hypothetical protein
MRYLILFTIFSCSISLFAQSNGDTATIILEEVKVIEVVRPVNNLGTICPIGYSPIRRAESKIGCSINLTIVRNVVPLGIVHVNHSFFGLPIHSFRFENVNQMANTVAGVLSMDGETPSILGARREGTAYYINGVKVLEGFLPETIEQ